MTMAGTGVQIALMTAPDAATAERIVRTLLDERLIACGNILPGVTSLYRWEGAVQRDAEVLVIMKTTEQAAAVLLERAPSLHPYDVPELLLLPVGNGHDAYLDWVFDSVSGPAGDGRHEAEPV
ncbi:MAG TPA: divalent-cation tolerance protein CutA [Longimicrobiales bacterium]|nr:divalent-cation tolerance protein CutA [Longimicrobiales bacterium]